MKKEYVDWIKNHYPTSADAYGQCYDATYFMVKDFPELKRIHGYYHSPIWGTRQHWWLQTDDGEIIDPTQHQFPGVNLLDVPNKEIYRDVTEDEMPIGKCMNCGELIFKGGYSSNICSELCADQFHYSLLNY